MTRVSGVVDVLQEREASRGGSYVLLRLNGQRDGLFDWDGCLADAGVQVGDEIAVEHTDGEYPRVKRVEKLSAGESQQDATGESRDGGNQEACDVQTARMCAVSAAARVLQESELGYEKRVQELTTLAEAVEQWLVRERDSVLPTSSGQRQRGRS